MTTTTTEKALLNFAVAMGLRAAQRDIETNERNLEGPFAEKTLKEFNLTREEVLAGVEEQRQNLKEMTELFKTYLTETGFNPEE